MSKLKIALLLTLLLGLVVSLATFAGGFKVVKYEDTSATIKHPWSENGEMRGAGLMATSFGPQTTQQAG